MHTFQFNTQVTVNTPSRRDGAITRKLEPKLEKLGRALAGGNMSTIAKAVYSNTDLRDQMVHKVLTEIEGECSTLCKRVLPNTGSPSLFRKIPVGAMPKFSWMDCVRELESNAPILFKCLMSVCSHSDHRNKDKRGDSHFPGICMAVACILKESNREMCGIQTLLSLLVYGCCVQKKVKMENFFYKLMCITV